MIRFVFSDILWALMLVYASFAAYSFMPSFLNRLELAFYDFRAGFVSIPSDVLPAVIEMPADRSDNSKMSYEAVSSLASLLSGSGSIPALTVFSSRIAIPGEEDSSFREIALLKDKYDELRKQRKITEKGNDFANMLAKMQSKDNPEKRLASKLSKIGNYVLPMSFNPGRPEGKLKSEPAWLKKFSAKAANGAALASAKAEGIAFYSQKGKDITEHAAGIGHDSLFPDLDGILRFESPFMAYNNNLYPSLALESSRIILGLSPGSIKFMPGKEIRIGEKSIPITPESTLPVHFSSVEPQRYSAQALFDGIVAAETFRDKVLILSCENHPSINTPKGMKPKYYFVVSALKTIMSDSFIERPDWTYKAELGMILVVGLFISMTTVYSRWLFHSLFFLMAGSLFFGTVYLFYAEHIWLKPVVPMICLASGYFFGIVKRFVLRYELKKIQYSSKPPPIPVFRKKKQAGATNDVYPVSAVISGGRIMSANSLNVNNPAVMSDNAASKAFNTANEEYTAERKQ